MLVCSRATCTCRQDFSGMGGGRVLPNVGTVLDNPRLGQSSRAGARSGHLRLEPRVLDRPMRTGRRAGRQTCNLSNRQAGGLSPCAAACPADRHSGRLATGQTGRLAAGFPCRQANMQTGNEAKWQAVWPIPKDRKVPGQRSLWLTRKYRQQR